MCCSVAVARPLCVTSKTNRNGIVANSCVQKQTEREREGERDRIIKINPNVSMKTQNSNQCIPNVCLKLFIDVFLVETKLMEHANQKPVLFLGVIFPLVGAIIQPQLMEWHEVA